MSREEQTQEAGALLRSARAWLEELGEEGVHSFEPLEISAPDQAETAPGPPVHDRDRQPAETMLPASAPTQEEPPTAHLSSLEDVRAELGECTRCGLCQGRNQIVFGEGNPQADLMFVGEGPGEQEDQTGRPFVGRAGELLTKMIEAGIETPRSEVYICNIVKCRPPGNRNPLPAEVAACRPFLDGQISAIQPKVVVTLGKPAASLLLGRDVAITRVRGTWHEYQGIPVMPTFHPAFILRQYTEENRRRVWEDLKAAVARARA